MFNAERLLGQVMGQALGGQLGGGKRHKKKKQAFGLPGLGGLGGLGGGTGGFGGGMGGGLGGLSGGKAAVGLGLLGVALAAYEHYSKKPGAGMPQPMAGPGAAVPPPPPQGMAATPPPPPPAADPALRTEQAMHLLRAMITAAYADGLMDPDEREALVDRARAAGLDPEEIEALEAEIRAPFTLEQLVVRTPRTLRAETYAAALVAITADTPEERAFLDRLAGELGLDDASRREVHSRLGLDD